MSVAVRAVAVAVVVVDSAVRAVAVVVLDNSGAMSGSGTVVVVNGSNIECSCRQRGGMTVGWA